MADMILAKPIFNPNTEMVKKIAATFIAGPEKRKVTAGPSPAPLFLMPANKGNIVQEQTAKMPPEIEAIVYESTLFALEPKYLKTTSFFTKTDIAPAIKKAGKRQVRTCSLAYSCSSSRPEKIAPVKIAESSGIK